MVENMSYQTDSEAFKISASAVKRQGNDLQCDDEVKKFKLEKSANAMLIPVTQAQTIICNNIFNTSNLGNKKNFKSRKQAIETSNVSSGYHLLLDETTLSEESTESICTKNFSSVNSDELMMIRKQGNLKDNSCGINVDFTGEERIMHAEGEKTLTSSSLINNLNSKTPVKRLHLGVSETKKALGEGIDVKVISNEQSGKVSVVNDKKNDQALLSATSGATTPQNTFTYSRVCTVSNVTTGTTVDHLSMKSLQGAVKNQSLMVTSKKIPPEVTQTQTTAKVSIGNTTISVPLLKPMNPTQIIQANTSASTEATKSVLHTLQAGSGPSAQFSKILNIKRGQKVTHPTYLSLAQVQIKPITQAKIVQAKVVSKKIPSHMQAIQNTKTSLIQQISGVVTITSSKQDQTSQLQQQRSINQILPSTLNKPQLSFVKEISSGTVIKTTEDIKSSVSSATNGTEQVTATSGTSILTNDSSFKVIEKQLPKIIAGGKEETSSVVATDFLPANVKLIHTTTAGHLNTSNIRSSLTAQIEQIDQNINQQQQNQQRINIGPTISIVRQNSPQLVTTSSSAPTVSLGVSDTMCTQQKVILTKSQFGSNTSSPTIATSVSNLNSMAIPRNISLMLAKSSASQPVITGAKNSLCVTTSANKTNSTRLNLNVNYSVPNSSSAIFTQTDTDAGSSTEPIPQAQDNTGSSQSRKIIQVIPGSLFSGSDNSFVQISKAKLDQPDEDKKKQLDGSSVEHFSQQQMQHAQQQQQTQTLHLQTQAFPQSQQSSPQQQMQHQQNQTTQQIQLQIQQQSHNNQQHSQNQQQQQQSALKQIQTMQTHSRQQQVQQQRQQLLHKHQIQQQIQKPQQQQQQQQQHASQLAEIRKQENSNSKPCSENSNDTDKLPHTSISYTANSSNVANMESNVPSKVEESNNVLLKQLLQNSNITPANSQNSMTSSNNTSRSSATANLPARKVINVRAPSLGLVSSLEAQLARPVIPPVPASEANSNAAGSSNAVSVSSNQDINKAHGQEASPSVTSPISITCSMPGNSSFITSITKSMTQDSIGGDKPKVSSTLISKETSFVSKPSLKLEKSDHSDQNLDMFALSQINDNQKAATELSSHSSHVPNQTYKMFAENALHSTDVTKVQASYQDVKKPPEQVVVTKSQQLHQNHQVVSSQQYNTLTKGSNLTAMVQNRDNRSTDDKKSQSTSANGANSQILAVTNSTTFLAKTITEDDLNNSNSHKQMECLTNSPQVQNQGTVQFQTESKVIKIEKDNSTKLTDAGDIQTAQLQHQQNMMQHQQGTTTSAQSSAAAPNIMQLNPTHSATSLITTDYSPSLAASSNKMHQLTNTQGDQTPSKDVEIRRKRKREQQKQRRQVCSNTKDTNANTSNTFAFNSNPVSSKKRSRKSHKLEEDYDSFIDNLLLHMRQMQPLQVLEPHLSVNYDVCKIYGWKNSPRSADNKSPVKDNRQTEKVNILQRELQGEYGSAYLPNKVPFYDSINFNYQDNKDDLHSSTIQNNYYDQEFSSFTYKTESEKLSACIKLCRERSVDTSEIICNRRTVPMEPVKAMRLNMLQQETFPGLILMSSTQQRMGRMSPVIPFVSSMALITKRKKIPLKSQENENLNGVSTKEDDLDSKHEMKNDVNTQTVILSLPSSSAERILDVLKNLANILQITAPITYRVLENNSALDTQRIVEHTPLTMSNRKQLSKYLSIQDILNGKCKMCRNCGKAIKNRCYRSSNDNTRTSLHSILVQPTQQRYFCTKLCYVQFRWCSEKKTPYNKAILGNYDDQCAMIAGRKATLKSLLDCRPNALSETTSEKPKAKKICFRYFNSKCFQSTSSIKKMSEKEIRDLLFKMDITMSVNTANAAIGDQGSYAPLEDRRQCVLCSQIGDGVTDGPSRLLNFDVDKWVHLNCALWSADVYETVSGGLMNFQVALQIGLNQICNTCQQLGATIKCYKSRCGAIYHLPCAIRDQCVFYQNKTIHCQVHASRNDKDKELNNLTVQRRVYVERDENRQVAAILHHSELMNLLRVGSLIFLNVGQLLPHQLEAFHTANFIYPIGYKIVRFYWSMRRPNKRCRYICSIAELKGHPEFRIIVQEPLEPDIELRDVSPKAVWQKVLQSVAEIRKAHNLVKLCPEYITGEDLFGLTEPSIVRIIESLPGVETLTNYRFKYGRNPLLDLPLALNPSGAARTEPKLRQLMGWKKPHTQRTCSAFNFMGHQSIPSVTAAGEATCPYSKQFVHSKSSQYKKMKQEWRNNVYLARSKIQGLGLYAARDMEKHTMIIEYIGEVIRTEVSEIREKQYEARNRGIYMFRLDEDRVVDATLCGGLARYINHSCNPNCVTEIVEVDRELRIIIFAKRRINRGEELSYDYKFDIEDDGNKIPCMCGAPNCRKWMN
ncbi:trithorax-related isoform 1-T1 [Glossina fuscipes fuscipes]